MTGVGVSDAVLQKIGTVGQISVQTMGDIDVDVSRLAIGTGAITRLPAMHELGADILLATDDGTHTTYCGLCVLRYRDPGDYCLSFDFRTARDDGVGQLCADRVSRDSCSLPAPRPAPDTNPCLTPAATTVV